VATPSRRLKLYRADEHLKDIEAILKPLRKRRQYPMVESVQRQRKRTIWEYRLDLDGTQLPEMLPILVGDYLFNVRSALDHLIVAIAPRKHRHKVSFPIHTRDPLASDETSGDYLDADAASRWLTLVKCLPSDCIACLKVLQPYEAATLYGHPAERHALALLSAFQNADKHRELVDVAVGLSKVEVDVDGDVTYAVPVFQNGTLVARAYRKMQVQIKGVPLVGLQRGQDIWSFDLLIERLARFIADEVLPRLEPLLKP
jgi:hypothetical protein